MGFLPGRLYAVYITTEHSTGYVILTGSAPDSTTTSCSINGTNLGVGKLGNVTTSSNTVDKVPFCEGMDIVKGWEDETANFFGTQKDYAIPIRKKWSITLTIKAANKGFSLLWNGARYGVTGSATGQLHTGLTEIKGDTGYRLYIFDGTKWDVFYHGIVTDYTDKPDPSKAVVQTVKFSGNEWSTSLGDAAISGAMAQE